MPVVNGWTGTLRQLAMLKSVGGTLNRSSMGVMTGLEPGMMAAVLMIMMMMLSLAIRWTE